MWRMFGIESCSPCTTVVGVVGVAAVVVEAC